jgi:hypothetical protein
MTSRTVAVTQQPDQGPEVQPTSDYWSLLFVFALSTLIGLGVIRRVSRLLHTPLTGLTTRRRSACSARSRSSHRQRTS